MKAVPPEDGPAMERSSNAPAVVARPATLVLPSWGGPDDDWQLNATVPVVEEGGSWRAAADQHGEAGVHRKPHRRRRRSYVITKVDLGRMVQTLTIDRTEPTADDLAALAVLKSEVKEFAGHM